MTDEVQQGSLIGGKYRIERPLAGGGMGNVYLATHLALGTQVALKMLRRDMSDKEVRVRFQREGVLAAQLDSDHVVRVTDLGWANPETPYLVMELLEGRDLQEEIDERKILPVPEAIDLLLQAAAGVAAAHSAGLVHRDLKPANLFLARRKGRSPAVVKVLDFGLSKALRHGVLDSLTHETARFGTPVYMSPEQIRSSKHVDARADQYALAAVLYQCVTGRLPFESEALTHLFVLVATQDPRRPSSLAPAVPSKLDKVILRGLAKEADERFADVASFAAAIAPFGSARAPALLEEVHVSMSSTRHPIARGLAERPAGARGFAERPPNEIESADTEDSSLNFGARVAEDQLVTPPLHANGEAPAQGSDDQLRTLIQVPREGRPRERERAADDSQVGMTSSMNAASQTRRRFAVASLAGGLSMLAIFLLVRALLPGSSSNAEALPTAEGPGPGSAPTVGEARPPAPVVEPVANAAPAVSAVADSPRPEPTQPAPPDPAAEPRATAPTPSAVAHSPREPPPSKPPGPKPGPRPKKNGEKSVLEVFGER